MKFYEAKKDGASAHRGVLRAWWRLPHRSHAIVGFAIADDDACLGLPEASKRNMQDLHDNVATVVASWTW